MKTSNPRVTILIPSKPVPASRPRVTRWGTYYGKRYTTWRLEVSAFLSQWRKENPDHVPIARPCVVSLEHIVDKPPTSKRSWPHGDVDNYDKAALDALVKSEILQDDDFVLQLHSYKAFTLEGQEEGTRITITHCTDY